MSPQEEGCMHTSSGAISHPAADPSLRSACQRASPMYAPSPARHDMQ